MDHFVKIEDYLDRQRFDFSDEKGFYIVKKGHVKIGVKSISSSRCISIAGPCEIIGGIQVHGVNYIVTPIGEVSVCYVERISYHKLVELNPGLFFKINEALANTEYCRQKQLYILSKRSVRERIAGTLLSLHEKLKKEENSAIISLDKTTIADLSNTTIETLSRMLTGFEEEGIVKRIAGDIEIRKPERLKFYFDN